MCDCCDGTDEVAGCNDSCAMLRELTRKDLQTKLDRYEAGAEARALLVPEAVQRRKDWTDLVHNLTPKVAELKEKVATLEGATSSYTSICLHLECSGPRLRCWSTTMYNYAYRL